MKENFARLFGEHLRRLRQQHRLSFRGLALLLKEEADYVTNHQTLYRLEQASAPIDSDFIKALAVVFKDQDAIWLACLAGQPPDEVIEKLVNYPELYLAPMLAPDMPIAVPEVLQVAHVFSIEAVQKTARLRHHFNVRFYEKGREALAALGADALFAVTTTVARKHAESDSVNRKTRYVELIELMAPTQQGLYNLYQVDSETPHYAYLKDSISETLASGYSESQEKSARHSPVLRGMQNLDQIAEALFCHEITGWFGWPPQDLKVLQLIAARQKTPGSIPREFRVRQQELDHVMKEKNLERNLVLLTTESVLERIHPSVITNLTDYLIRSGQQMLAQKNKKERAEAVKQALCHVPEMRYLSCDWWKSRNAEEKKYRAERIQRLDEHLSELTFHITIREAAFPYLTSRRNE